MMIEPGVTKVWSLTVMGGNRREKERVENTTGRVKVRWLRTLILNG